MTVVRYNRLINNNSNRESGAYEEISKEYKPMLGCRIIIKER